MFAVPRLRPWDPPVEVHLTMPHQQLECLARTAVDTVLNRPDAYGPFHRVPWPLPAGKALQVYFHVSPIQDVEHPVDRGHYGLSMAVALVAALTGRRTRPGVYMLGEIMPGGEGRVASTEQLEPQNAAREVGWLGQLTDQMQKLVVHRGCVASLRRMIGQHGAARLRERVQVAAIDTLQDAVDEALL